MLARGKNLDSGGSSGSGKSTLLLALAYAFGYCPFPATALQTWLTDEPLEVEVTLTVKAGELVISRGQGLKLELNGKAIKGSAKQLEEKLAGYIGLAPALLAALTYRGQKKPGLFLSKTDAEKKEFLTVLLDLGKYEAQAEACNERIKALEQDVYTADYVVGDLTKRLAQMKENFKPALIADEKNLQGQLDLSTAHSERIRNQIQTIRLEVKEYERKVEEGAARIRADAKPRLDEIEQKLQDACRAKPDLSQIDCSGIAAAEADLKQGKEYLDAEIAADQARYREQRRHADSVHAQILLIERRLTAKPGLERQIADLKTEIEHLKAQNCPTCSRPWEEAKAALTFAETNLRAMLSDLEGLTNPDPKPEIERLQAEYKRLGDFTPSPAIQELRDVVAQCERALADEISKVNLAKALAGKDLETKVEKLRAELNVARAGVSDLVNRYRSDQLEKIQGKQDELESLDREVQMSDSQSNGIRAALSRVQIDNARERERVTQLEANMKKLEADLEGQKQGLAALKLKLNAELDFQKLVGREGFLGTIFDEVLWEISQETNQLLAQFPNTAHVTLNFRSEATSQKGNITKRIVPFVSIGGFDAPLSSGLSGGMESAVELAVDLAVATVVSRRTGSSPGWLVLDESFTGLGPVEAEASMEILRAFAHDKLVLVVDHASEFKSMFTQFVDVEYQGGFSRVVAS